MSDRTRLYTCAFLRSFGTGLAAVVLGIYLSELGLSPAQMGGVVTAGLAGAAAASFAATFHADRWGRRRSLILVSALGVVGTIGVAVTSHPWLLCATAFIGMLNGMGRDRGAALVLDQSILASVVTDQQRTRAFAIYNVVQDVGHALGSLAAGLPALLVADGHPPTAAHLTAYQWALAVNAGLLLVSAAVYAGLSPTVESPSHIQGLRISSNSRRVLARLSALFLVDALGGGLTTTLVSYFFLERFHAAPEVIAGLFFVARIANAASHLAAAWLAQRIGLVNTMVFTHIPSSVLLVTVAFAPNFLVAAILFVLRESLVEMDVPTRQSYIMAIVRPEERTVASGVTNLVRMAAWATAPAVAGLFMEQSSLAAPLVIGGGLKIAYDVALFVAFRSIKPPEESTTTRNK